MKTSTLLIASSTVLASALFSSAASAAISVPVPPDPNPPIPPGTSPLPIGIGSAADLEQEQTATVNGNANSESTSINQNAYRNNNTQINYSSAPGYAKIGDIQYETTSLYVNAGASGGTYYSGNDYRVEVGVRIPLGGRLAKRVAKERAQRDREIHCVNLANSGFITDECANIGLKQITKPTPVAVVPTPPPVVHHTPTPTPLPTPPPPPIRGLW